MYDLGTSYILVGLSFNLTLKSQLLSFQIMLLSSCLGNIHLVWGHRDEITFSSDSFTALPLTLKYTIYFMLLYG